MSQEIKRVPLNFDWPLDKTWPGYVIPEELATEKNCPDCEIGYSAYGQKLHDQWYGNAPFDPAETGSTPLTVDTPAVRAFAERNVTNSPGYYGTGEAVIVREAQRLLGYWNNQWSHHLEQADVDALIAAGRLIDFTHQWDRESRRWVEIDPAPVVTAQQVNEWHILTMGHDGINQSYVLRARAERDGKKLECETCDGHGSIEAYGGQRALVEAWKGTEPPEGPGYQVWQTISAGSPITPVFETPEELARHLASTRWGNAEEPLAASIEHAMAFITAGHSVASGATIDGKHYTGINAVLAFQQQRDDEG